MRSTTTGPFPPITPDELRALTPDELRTVTPARLPESLRLTITQAKEYLRCECGHLRSSHGHQNLSGWLVLGLGRCFGHPALGPCRETPPVDPELEFLVHEHSAPPPPCQGFTLLTGNEAPVCTLHGRPMLRRAGTTWEEQWCGWWYDCPLDTCSCVILLPSPELVAYGAGRETAAAWGGDR